MISVDSDGAVTVATPAGEAGSLDSDHTLELVSALNHAIGLARDMRAVS